MKIWESGIDANGRSTHGLIEIPLKKISETEAVSARQPGTIWRIGMRATTNLPRTDKNYESAGGPFEQHVGGEPHIIAWMSGYIETTLQDGSTKRLAPGDVTFTRPGSLHHANLFSNVPPTLFNLYLPGTALDIGTLDVKK